MKVVSLAYDTWRFRPGQCSVWIFVRRHSFAPSRFWLLLLLLLFLLLFLLLLRNLVFSFISSVKRRGRERGRIRGSRRLVGNSGLV